MIYSESRHPHGDADGVGGWGTYDRELADGLHEFRMPPDTYPIRLGLAADVGQTVAACVELTQGALALNRRVDLHAIDATPARWRGVGSSPLDGSSAPDTLVDFRTGRVESEL